MSKELQNGSKSDSQQTESLDPKFEDAYELLRSDLSHQLSSEIEPLKTMADDYIDGFTDKTLDQSQNYYDKYEKSRDKIIDSESFFEKIFQDHPDAFNILNFEYKGDLFISKPLNSSSSENFIYSPESGLYIISPGLFVDHDPTEDEYLYRVANFFNFVFSNFGSLETASHDSIEFPFMDHDGQMALLVTNLISVNEFGSIRRKYFDIKLKEILDEIQEYYAQHNGNTEDTQEVQAKEDNVTDLNAYRSLKSAKEINTDNNVTPEKLQKLYPHAFMESVDSLGEKVLVLRPIGEETLTRLNSQISAIQLKHYSGIIITSKGVVYLDNQEISQDLCHQVSLSSYRVKALNADRYKIEYCFNHNRYAVGTANGLKVSPGNMYDMIFSLVNESYQKTS